MKYNRNRVKKNRRIQEKVNIRAQLANQFPEYNPKPNSEKTIQNVLELKPVKYFQ